MENATMNTAINPATYEVKTLYFTFDHVKRTINGKACDFKRAGIPNSEHERELNLRRSAYPTYSLNPILPKRKKAPKTYAGLNESLMKNYMALLTDNSEARKKWEELVTDEVPFPTKKSWFLKTFPKITVDKMKKAISAGRVQKYLVAEAEPDNQQDTES